MPPTTVGLGVWGEVTAADDTDDLMPAVRRAANEHAEIRLGFQAGADVTKGLALGVENWSACKRMAVVTDVDWLRHAMQMMGWMTPGEARLFALDELPRAKKWVAG